MALELLDPDEIGRRVRSAREEVGVNSASLADRLGVPHATVERLEAGILDPLPGDYILTIADALRMDYRYFISNELDEEESSVVKVYRALAEPTHGDKFAIRRFINFAIGEYELSALTHEMQVTPPTQTPSGRLHKEQGVNAAISERARLKLGDEPIRDVFGLIRASGVRLFRHSLADSKLSGLTVVHPRAGVAVLVNYVDDLFRQFFSAAHEYSHVLLDRGDLHKQGCIVSYTYSRKDLAEIRANAFAGEFLLPTAAVRRFESSRRGMRENELVLRIAREYHVNTGTVAIKLGDLGWIDQLAVDAFLSTNPPARVPRAEKLDPELPPTLTEKQAARRLVAIREGISASYLEALRRALAAGEVTWGRASELLELGGDDTREFMASVGAAV